MTASMLAFLVIFRRHMRVFRKLFYLLLGNSTSPRTESILNRGVKGSHYVYPSGPSSELIVQLHEAMPALAEAVQCSFGVDHSNMIV